MKPIRLIIADDYSIVREGIKLLLESERDVQVIAETECGSECLHMLSELNPELLILDICMSDQSGFDILKNLNKNGDRKSKVLILTDNDAYCGQNFLKCYDIGIDGYLLKNAEPGELKKAIYSIIKNKDIYIQTELYSILDNREKYETLDRDRIYQLTNRELDILKHLSVGMYNKEIATKLNISERTVKNHISSIFKKIGVSDRTQAAVFSIRNNLVDIYT